MKCGNSPRHPEHSEGSPGNGTYLKIVPLHGDPSSQAPRDDVGSYEVRVMPPVELICSKVVQH